MDVVSAVSLLVFVVSALVFALRTLWRRRPLLDDETFAALADTLKERGAGCNEIEQVYRTVFRRRRFTLDQTIKIILQCKHSDTACVYRRDMRKWIASEGSVENISDEILQEAREQAVERLLAASGVGDKKTKEIAG